MNKENQIESGEFECFERTKEQWLDDALKNYKNEAFHKVIFACERAIEIDNQFLRAYHGKGLALGKLERYEEALAVYQEAIKTNSKYWRIYKEKADLLANLDRHEEAIDCYNSAIKLNHSDDYMYFMLGCMFSGLHKFMEAATSFEKSLQLKSSDYGYYYYGESLMHLGRYEEAVIAFRKSSSFGGPYTHEYTGQALVYLGRIEEAIEAYKYILSLDDQYSIHGYDYLGHLYCNVNRYEEAWTLYQQKGALCESTSFHEELGNYFYDQKMYSNALELYNSCKILSAMSFYKKGCLLSDNKRYEEAFFAFKQSINLDCTNKDAWLRKSEVLEVLGRLDASNIHKKVAEMIESEIMNKETLTKRISEIAALYTRNLI